MTKVRANIDAYGVTGRKARAPAPRRSLRLAILASWKRHHDLLSNAGSLLATTGVTSALGFVYWAFAARVFSQQAVGYSSAAVSAMQLLGTIGMLGLGTLLIGELPRRSQRAGLVSAALLTCGLGSLILGVGFAVAAPHFSERFANMTGTPGRAALLAAGVVLTGVSLVFDQATIGLMRGGLQLWRNSVLAVAKMLVLPVTAVILHDQFGVGITLSWVTGIVASLLSIAIRLQLGGTPVLHRPDWNVLRSLGKTAMAHNWLNLAIMMPTSLVPVLVTVIVSPSANAAFYVATMITSFVFIVPTHLATVLFAVVAADPKVVARKLRFALRLSFIIGLPGMAALLLGSHLVLGVFGKGYVLEATLPMCLITLGYPAAVPKALYIAVCRADGRISRAAVVLSACSAAEVAAAAVGGVEGGLIGLSYALLIVRFAEALVTAPPVVRAAFGHGRHRRAETLTAAAGSCMGEARVDNMLSNHRQSLPPEQPMLPGCRHRAHVASGMRSCSIDSCRYAELATFPERTNATMRIRQEAGIAALLSLARCVSTTMPFSVVPASMHGSVLDVGAAEPSDCAPLAGSGTSTTRRQRIASDSAEFIADN